MDAGDRTSANNMNKLSKSEAQQRVDQINSFQAEMQELERGQVLHLSNVQQQALKDYHSGLVTQLSQSFDIDHDQRTRQLSLGMRIASFLGALALAASVFFLFYQYWGRINNTAQVTILIAAPLIMFMATMLIAARDHSGYFTKLAAMVAFACFVLNLVMLGQIFNITPSDRAFVVWAAFAFLLAYSCDARLLLAAGIICISAFISARTGTWSGMYWLDFGERPENFFPAAVIMFLVPQFIDHRHFWGFASIYRVFALLLLLLPVLLLANWGDGSYIDADDEVIEGGYQMLGFVLSALAIWLGLRRHWAELVNTGNVFFVIFLYTKMFDWWWEIMPKYLFFLIIGLTAILFLLVFKRLRVSALFSGRRAQ
jgi:uncharacterized membrane protein